jgi:hypothetical protein
MTGTLHFIPNGDALKAAGQARAASAAKGWRLAALAMLRQYLKVTKAVRQHSVRFTFDDFRTWALAQGIGEPPTLNAWGSLPRSAVSQGMVLATGEYKKARRADAHSRMVCVWEAA